jgi:hypothetical protein
VPLFGGMQRTFRGRVEAGHKGPAIIVPFDPADALGIAPQAMPYFGTRLQGFPVSVSVGKTRHDTWIGGRWGRHFILADGPLTALKPGDEVEVTVRTRALSRAGSRRPRRR